jgi:FkbM family methyltransferase
VGDHRKLEAAGLSYTERMKQNCRGMQEALTVRVVRAGFRRWPFERGRGWLLRLSRQIFPQPLAYRVGAWTRIEAALDDSSGVWTFMCRHEDDEPFQRSLDLLPPGGVAVDIGANIGVWSLLAAERRPDARIHAFEPVPEVAEHCRRHLALNRLDTIVLNVAAVAAEDGDAPFYAIRTANTGASSLIARRVPADAITVPVVTLDTYVARAPLDRVDVVKVDVEGAERLVFAGGRRTLSRADAPAIFFEVDERLCAAAGTTPRAVKELLIEYGYGIFHWRRGAFVPVATDARHGHEDLFALKPRHLAALAT